jgi:hypothetical protein
MTSRRVLSLILTIAFVATSCMGVAAQPVVDGTVNVTVVEQDTKAPAPRVFVRIFSTAIEYDGITDAAGNVRFEHVKPGSYVVEATDPNYTFDGRYTVAVTAGSGQVLTFLGVRTAPRRIGRTEARAPTRPNVAQSTDRTSAGSEIAGTTAGGLAANTAVTIGGTGAIGIHNHGADSTTVTLNGSPIFPTGSRAQLGLINSDIFSSGGLNAAGTIGAPNGALNVQTPDPTIDWTGLIQERGATFGSNAVSFQERGTAGRLGLSVVHSSNDQVGALDGRAFADTSGRYYDHDASQVSGGTALGLRYGVRSGHVLFASAGLLTASTPLECGLSAGPVPCGFGPGNRSQQDLRYVQLRDSLTLDHAVVESTFFASTLASNFDFDRQLVEGISVGSSGAVASRRVGGSIRAGVGPIDRMATLSVSAFRDVSSIGGSAALRGAVPPHSSSLASIMLDYPLVQLRRLTISTGVGSNTGFGSTHPIASVSGNYQLNNRDRAVFSYRTGAIPTSSGTFDAVDAPELLQVECASGRALGQGPTQNGTNGDSRNIRAGLHHATAGHDFTIDAFRDDDRNALVTGHLAGSVLSGMLFAPDYFTRASFIASEECGAPIGLAPQTTAFLTSAPVSRLLTDGVDVGLRSLLTPTAELSVAASLARSRPFGTSLLFAPGSDVTAGRQLPSTPLIHLNVSGRAALSRSTTLLVSGNYYSADNAWSRRAFSSVDVGARFRLPSSDVFLGIQNVTDANRDDFARFDPFPVVRSPYTPRTISLRVRLALGRENIDKVPLLTATVLASNSVFYVPNNFEADTRKNWLAPATDVPFCGPEDLAVVRPYEQAIQHFDESVTGEPGPPKDVRFGAMTMSAVRTGDGFMTKIVLDRGNLRALKPFLQCSLLHTGDYDEASRLGLYVPDLQERQTGGSFVLYYSHVVGLYFAPIPVQQTDADRSARTGFPSATPRRPFEIGGSCPASLGGAVAEAGRALKTYADGYYAGRKPAEPDGFHIAAHPAKRETWLEIRPESRAIGRALISCLDVPEVRTADIDAAGLGGAFTPSINYAPSVGLYTKAP